MTPEEIFTAAFGGDAPPTNRQLAAKLDEVLTAHNGLVAIVRELIEWVDVQHGQDYSLAAELKRRANEEVEG